MANSKADMVKFLEDWVDPPNYDPAVNELEKAIELAKKSRADPELVETLERSRNLVRQREEFTLYCTAAESDTCKKIKEKTINHDWTKTYKAGQTIWNLQSPMMTGPLEGQFLKSIASIQKAKRVLDIGMFTGYSALSIAEALPEDGEVVTVDHDKYLKSFVEDTIKTSPHRNKVKILIGNALELLNKMVANGEQFDMIFLDADKTEYLDYLKLAFENNLLKLGGTVVMDNCYFYGQGYSGGDSYTKTVAEAIVANTSLHYILVPIRDGIMLIRRLSDVEGRIAGK